MYVLNVFNQYTIFKNACCKFKNKFLSPDSQRYLVNTGVKVVLCNYGNVCIWPLNSIFLLICSLLPFYYPTHRKEILVYSLKCLVSFGVIRYADFTEGIVECISKFSEEPFI